MFISVVTDASGAQVSSQRKKHDEMSEEGRRRVSEEAREQSAPEGTATRPPKQAEATPPPPVAPVSQPAATSIGAFDLYGKVLLGAVLLVGSIAGLTVWNTKRM
jgi:hypothetical protein